jgi:hypothetical protein
VKLQIQHILNQIVTVEQTDGGGMNCPIPEYWVSDPISNRTWVLLRISTYWTGVHLVQDWGIVSYELSGIVRLANLAIVGMKNSS